jgi:hypothetical protein
MTPELLRIPAANNTHKLEIRAGKSSHLARTLDGN